MTTISAGNIKATSGPAATIEVKLPVIQGPPGSNPIITNVGTSSHAQFEFTIPSGPVGPGITSTDISYCIGPYDGSLPPSSQTWVTDITTINAGLGDWLWTKFVYHYSSGSTTTAYSKVKSGAINGFYKGHEYDGKVIKVLLSGNMCNKYYVGFVRFTGDIEWVTGTYNATDKETAYNSPDAGFQSFKIVDIDPNVYTITRENTIMYSPLMIYPLVRSHTIEYKSSTNTDILTVVLNGDLRKYSVIVEDNNGDKYESTRTYNSSDNITKFLYEGSNLEAYYVYNQSGFTLPTLPGDENILYYFNLTSAEDARTSGSDKIDKLAIQKSAQTNKRTVLTGIDITDVKLNEVTMTAFNSDVENPGTFTTTDLKIQTSGIDCSATSTGLLLTASGGGGGNYVPITQQFTQSAVKYQAVNSGNTITWDNSTTSTSATVNAGVQMGDNGTGSASVGLVSEDGTNGTQIVVSPDDVTLMTPTGTRATLTDSSITTKADVESIAVIKNIDDLSGITHVTNIQRTMNDMAAQRFTISDTQSDLMVTMEEQLNSALGAYFEARTEDNSTGHYQNLRISPTAVKIMNYSQRPTLVSDDVMTLADVLNVFNNPASGTPTFPAAVTATGMPHYMTVKAIGKLVMVEGYLGFLGDINQSDPVFILPPDTEYVHAGIIQITLTDQNGIVYTLMNDGSGQFNLMNGTIPAGSDCYLRFDYIAD